MRHVLITGAGRGVGRQIARLFHAHGDKVSLMSRREGDLATLAAELGSRVAHAAADVSDPASSTRALATLAAKHGPVDILVNNAGVGFYKPFAEHTPDELSQVLATNLTGLVHLTHAVVRTMLPRKSGQLIHVGSDIGRRPLANMAVYVATKHALAGFSQSLARELRGDGIKSILVNPGMIDSDFNGGREGSRGEGALATADVARLVLHVANLPERVLVDEVSVHDLGQDF